jgi:hypothetical protein
MRAKFDELRKRFQVRNVLGITVESSRTVVDLVRSDEKGTRRAASFTLPLGADAILSNPAAASQELAAHLAAAGMRERRAVVCVPAGWALTTSLDVPQMRSEDLLGYLELRAEREFPVPLPDLRLAHSAFALPDGTQRATLAGLPAARMEAIELFLAGAGCRAASVSLGLDACVPRDEAPTTLHFLANGTHVDMVIATGGGIAAVRSLPAPPRSDPEASFDSASFSREVRITLGQLPEALRQRVREARFGGTPKTAERLCREIRPQLERLGIDSRLRPAVPGDEAPPAAGFAAAGHFLKREPVVFEFLPPRVHRLEQWLVRFGDRRNRWIAGAAAAVVLLPVLAFFVRSRIESSLNSEWQRLGGTVSELEQVQQKIRQFRSWFDPAPQTLPILEAVAAAFPDQGDVWARIIEVGEGGRVTCTGSARTQAAVMTMLERIRTRPEVETVQVQQMRGDNPVQFTVIIKWEARDAK